MDWWLCQSARPCARDREGVAMEATTTTAESGVSARPRQRRWDAVNDWDFDSTTSISSLVEQHLSLTCVDAVQILSVATPGPSATVRPISHLVILIHTAWIRPSEPTACTSVIDNFDIFVWDWEGRSHVWKIGDVYPLCTFLPSSLSPPSFPPSFYLPLASVAFPEIPLPVPLYLFPPLFFHTLLSHFISLPFLFPFFLGPRGLWAPPAATGSTRRTVSVYILR